MRGSGVLVEPPVREPEFVGNRSGLIENDTMRLEYRIDVAGRPARVVRQRHRRSAERPLARAPTRRPEPPGY
jgi:hypothetical protein